MNEAVIKNPDSSCSGSSVGSAMGVLIFEELVMGV